MKTMVMKRKIYDELVKWKNNDEGKTAILIEGARRVGKSTIAREFASNEYRSHLFIDFVKPLPGTLEAFEKYRHDTGLLLSNLSLLYNVRLIERKSLIIFDEIQRYPPAREMIKYLVEDGRYDYLETGSLISIKMNVKDIQIPSEEVRIRMHPMDFEEFLWASGDEVTFAHVKECFYNKKPLGQILHGTIMEKYKTYMLVGGMPQAVLSYVRNHDLQDAESVKRNIIKLYSDDMLKIDVVSGAKAKMVFESIPSMLSSHKKTFRPGSIRNDARTAEFSDGIMWLEESRICNICRSNNDPNSAMNLNRDAKSMKCYMGDTGLLITMSFNDGTVTTREVMEALIKDRLSINQGMFFENSVAQSLVSSGRGLFFTEFYDKGDRKHLFEVDFLIVRGKKITPVEVKSSVSSKHRSLDLLMEKYPSRIEEAFVVHGKDLRIDGKTTYVPIYMASLL